MSTVAVGYATADVTGKYWPLESVQTTSSTGTINNFSISTTTSIIVASGAAPAFTGFANGRSGRFVWLYYTGAGTLTIADQSASSSAGNKVYCPTSAGLSLPAKQLILLFYDGTDWRAVQCLASVNPTLVGATFSGTLALADNLLTRPEIKDFAETLGAPSISAGTLTCDFETGNNFAASLNANITTLTMSNPSATGKLCPFTIVLTADGTLRTIAFPASFKWPGGSAPTVATSTSGRKIIISGFTVDAGTRYEVTGFLENVS